MMNINNISFGSKLGNQKTTNLLKNESAKLVDSAHQKAVDILNQQRPLIEQTEIAMKNTLEQYKPSMATKILNKILFNPLFKFYEKIFKG